MEGHAEVSTNTICAVLNAVLANGNCFAALDFEASSLDQDSYPIECGLALGPAADEPMSVWSTLIAPCPAWTRSGRWSSKSQRVHGIAQQDLSPGLSPRAVATELNARCAAIGTVWCDGGDYDRYWLKRLFDAAGLEPAFVLLDVSQVLLPDDLRRFTEALAVGKSHRAGADAERLCSALIREFARERSRFS